MAALSVGSSQVLPTLNDPVERGIAGSAIAPGRACDVG